MTMFIIFLLTLLVNSENAFNSRRLVNCRDPANTDSNNMACCNSNHLCGVGGGDCDNDSDCKQGLKCGYNNCRVFNVNFVSWADCCYEPKCQDPDTTNDHSTACCSSALPCAFREGDCDSDSDCQGDLICDWNKCLKWNSKWISWADCCNYPKNSECSYPENSSQGSPCCSPSKKCRAGQGTCRNHADCVGGLKCGVGKCNNKYVNTWAKGSKCCYKPHHPQLAAISQKMQELKENEDFGEEFEEEEEKTNYLHYALFGFGGFSIVAISFFAFNRKNEEEK